MKKNDFISTWRIFPDANPGWALRALRVREGLTQLEMAYKLGISRSHISSMERWTRKITKKMSKLIMKIFKVDYRIFLEE